MKISRVLICALFAGLFLPITSPVAHAANTQVNCGTSGYYTVNDSGTVVSSTNCQGAVTFGSNVIAIGGVNDGTPGVFGNRDSLTVVTIGPTVKLIGKFAFYNGTIQTLNFSEGLETISAYAFSGVGGGSTINLDVRLPDSLRSIGDRAFESARMGAISMGGNVTSIGVYAFSSSASNYGAKAFEFRDLNMNITLPVGMLYGYLGEEVILPNTITTVPNDFTGYSSQKLQFMILPTGVTSFAANAFNTQQNLRTIVLPDSLASVPSNAFSSYSLTNVIYCGSDNAIQNYIYPNNTRPYCAKVAFFRPNGAIGTTKIETATVGSTKALTLNTYTRTGYTFTGWNTKIDGSGTSFSDGESISFNSHLVLYAQWHDNSISRSSNVDSAEERRKRQEKIDKNRLALVQKVKSGELVINSDLIDSDLPTLTVELREKANNELASQSNSKDFSFKDIQKVIAKYDLYQAIQNGLRGIVHGRVAVSASIIASSVPQKELLISQLMALDPSKRSTVEAIDRAIATFTKAQLDRKAKLAAIIAGKSRTK